jgi:hypothetical protein
MYKKDENAHQANGRVENTVVLHTAGNSFPRSNSTFKGYHARVQTSTSNLGIDLSLVLLHNFFSLFLFNPTKAALFFAFFIFAY